MWAEIVTSLSLLALVERLPNTRTAMAASATHVHSFFISYSFSGTKNTPDKESEGCCCPVRPKDKFGASIHQRGAMTGDKLPTVQMSSGEVPAEKGARDMKVNKPKWKRPGPFGFAQKKCL